ncbi:Squamous cell carcinoma antigen recognized by T-cells 3 [Habropoda laboriosa]|uniref:Squamous cell carcinoma antigen recognized by T-cells 3 n=1 Tax=Habropoda laboriosa TaxID=597456 RepID=A0A0L7QUR5_9HYME|nr:PREDICTED: squamous cell carcinoma antigen recognized by T-cells 3 [Habropoda laboriosa]KOC62368.1 Squamous cell carcinoma antigen recognized by T-cells 3 [Habropoda laboriosa]
MEEMDVGNEESNGKSLRENLADDKEDKSELIEDEAHENMDDEPADNELVDDNQDEDDDEEDADEAEVKVLLATLAENPYDYTTHVSLINKFKKMGELERLRTARENMSSKYPLSPDLWLSWIQDEINLSTTPEQKAEVVNLCERAVKDYLSVKVWLEYLQFSIGNMGTEKDAAKNVRQLFERALTAVGLHTIKGAIIWEAFREFEVVLYALIDPLNQAERKEQLERIANLFKRQLACPLLDMEKTYEEYEAWHYGDGAEAVIDDKIVAGGYERALKQLNVRLPYEEKIVSAQNENELLDSYKIYLSYEKQHGDPGRITVLYERAITDLSLEMSIWLDYLTYLEENIKIESVLDQVYQRASRNVPWCAKMWQKWMRSYEKWGKTTLEVQTLLENALAAGFSTAEDYRNLWITYLEYLRRKIDRYSTAEKKQLEILRNAFNRACEHLAKSFGLEGDPNCIILQYWARTEAIHAANMEKSRTLWADILSQGHSATASYWLEYISLESCYGDTKNLRKLYQKALASVKDWPESIANAWMNFERDEGKLEQMELCEARTKEKLDKVAEERQKTQQTCSHELSPLQSKKTHKRKQDDIGKWKNLGGSPTKITKVEIQTKQKSKESRLNIEKKVDADTEEQKSKIAPPPGFKAPDNEQTEADAHEVDDKITVFVSNLDYTATEEEVKNALEPAGPITMFKMIRDYKGRSKGFCYVQLSNAEAVEKALKLDRTPIGRRPMFVSRCNPNRTRGAGFKYSCTLEKNKLFVKGLPVTTTKEDLEGIFKVHGTLKEVRVVTYRNGHSKGLAYVDFEDENSAAKALLATDGMKIGDKVISVAISQPPERKKAPMTDEMVTVKSLGGTTVSRTTFGMPKTLLSIIPRTVKIPATNGSASVSGNGVPPKMNNQDFRNMLLNKK